MHSSYRLRARGTVRVTVTTLFGVEIETRTTPGVADARPKKYGWLPLLIVLFLISYSLMTMLIVEQGRTIDSQRALIRDLFHDNNELAAAKRAQPDSSLTQDTQARLAQNPATKAPSNQARSSQGSSSPVGSQRRAQNSAPKAKSDFQVPSEPASDLVDSDRSLKTI
jgi:hypothetical protein